MDIVVTFVLTVAIASYVAWPLLSSAPTSNSDAAATDSSGSKRWELQKREAYAAIKEAEFDHQMGKLSDADFEVVQRKYRDQALAAIAAIEHEHASMGGAAGKKPSRIAYCPNCGRSVPQRANFCPGCGTSLETWLKQLAA